MKPAMGGRAAPAGYLVVHNRDRDFYEVALAFEEAGALAGLVTDFARSRDDARRHPVERLLRGRQPAPIRAAAIHDCWTAVALQAIHRFDRWTDTDWMLRVDRALAQSARRLARETPGADLVFYHNYALEAFRDPKLADRRRHLFLFHPHPRFNHAVLQADLDRFGVGAASIREEVPEGPRADRLDEELARADHVICASSLSARSVAHAGFPEVPVSRVPYGSAGGRKVSAPTPRAQGAVRFLFVGQAIQRKGLHHLLAVWRRLRPVGAELTLVCSRDPDGILTDLPDGVTVRSNITNAELVDLYQSSHCLLLPALIEGFGLVLLEALQAGCYTIFSDATGLVDCEVPDFAGRQVTAGDLDGLAVAIEQTIDLAARGEIDPVAISGFAETRSAANFRRMLREAVAAAEALPMTGRR